MKTNKYAQDSCYKDTINFGEGVYATKMTNMSCAEVHTFMGITLMRDINLLWQRTFSTRVKTSAHKNAKDVSNDECKCC